MSATRARTLVLCLTHALRPPRSVGRASMTRCDGGGSKPLLPLRVPALGPGPGWPAVARPGGGEVQEGVDDRVVAVGVPDEARSDGWAVAQRERDHARMC